MKHRVWTVCLLVALTLGWTEAQGQNNFTRQVFFLFFLTMLLSSYQLQLFLTLQSMPLLCICFLQPACAHVACLLKAHISVD